MSFYANFEKTIGSFHLNVHLEGGNETIALLGPSGCGKSMTLKCIAGLETPDRGRITLDGTVLFDSEQKINLPPQQRNTGFMFQNYALFPHMTVFQNVYTGACQFKDRRKRTEFSNSILNRFGLNELSERLPDQLSGGQQQGVALARMLASQPAILLLDEPFSALDRHLRFQMEQEIRGILKEYGKTAVLVSHDRDEVYRMSTKTAVMEYGSVAEFGATSDIFSSPKTVASAILTGCRNVSPVRIVSENKVFAIDWGIELEIPVTKLTPDFVGIRSEDICFGSAENSFICRVTDEIEDLSCCTRMLRPNVCAEGAPLVWTLSKELRNRTKSEVVEIHIPKNRILLLHS